MGKPLLDVLRGVVLDPAEQAAFTYDPSTYLAQYGYEDVAADDLSEAFGLVADTLPPDVAQAVASTAPATAVEDLGDAAEGGAFGEVTQDFDAVGDGGDGLVPDDAFGADFGTGEVAEVPEVDEYALREGSDAAAFGEGSESDGGFGSDGSFTADTFEDTAFDEGGFAAEAAGAVDAVDAVDITEAADVTGEGDTYEDDLGDHLDDGGLPDDPGDVLDDIGSF